jgi:hypothetical protein
MNGIDHIYGALIQALKARAMEHMFLDEAIPIHCQPLSAAEALGSPTDGDYPILKGKEAIVEAEFRDAKGHAFSDEYGNNTCTIRELISTPPSTNRERAEFVAALNAVYRHLGLVEKTVHCRDDEPVDCARELAPRIAAGMQLLLVGFQPRMLEHLSARTPVRCVDLDADNIGTDKFGVTVEGPEKTDEAIAWAHAIVATGSTLVNGTIPTFLQARKPVIFYGVTISAAARILQLDHFCHLGH